MEAHRRRKRLLGASGCLLLLPLGYLLSDSTPLHVDTEAADVLIMTGGVCWSPRPPTEEIRIFDCYAWSDRVTFWVLRGGRVERHDRRIIKGRERYISL
jgi:hypothetical protein